MQFFSGVDLQLLFNLLDSKDPNRWLYIREYCQELRNKFLQRAHFSPEIIDTWQVPGINTVHNLDELVKILNLRIENLNYADFRADIADLLFNLPQFAPKKTNDKSKKLSLRYLEDKLEQEWNDNIQYCKRHGMFGSKDLQQCARNKQLPSWDCCIAFYLYSETADLYSALQQSLQSVAHMTDKKDPSEELPYIISLKIAYCSDFLCAFHFDRPKCPILSQLFDYAIRTMRNAILDLINTPDPGPVSAQVKVRASSRFG